MARLRTHATSVTHVCTHALTHAGATRGILTTPGHFGEGSLLGSTRSRASVTSVTLTQLLTLDKDEFEAVLELYPQMKKVRERTHTQAHVCAQRAHALSSLRSSHWRRTARRAATLPCGLPRCDELQLSLLAAPAS